MAPTDKGDSYSVRSALSGLFFKVKTARTDFLELKEAYLYPLQLLLSKSIFKKIVS